MKRKPGANAIFSVGLLHPPSNDNQACSSKSDYPKKATEENPKQPASWNNIRVRCIYIKTHPRETTQARTPIEWCVLQNVGLKDGGIRRQRKLALRISKVGTVRRQIIAFYILGRSTTTVFLSLIAACLYFLSFFFCLPPHEKGIDYSTYINIYIWETWETVQIFPHANYVKLLQLYWFSSVLESKWIYQVPSESVKIRTRNTGNVFVVQLIARYNSSIIMHCISVERLVKAWIKWFVHHIIFAGVEN